MAKRITAIPATLNRFTSSPVLSQEKRKVAGYARVSTGLEEQQSSYENQVNYYTNYIKSRDDWEFVEVYTDEGITATNTAHRDGFNRMIDDALAGKIDLIVTKSVSRFARNTVDSLTAVRKLKEKGVEIYFEKENIWTLDSKGELLITIMSSLAQEESRSISENTTWGKRKSFADGKVSVAFTRFLGYDKDFVINEEEAETVRLIYKLFLSGCSIYAIKRELTARGRKTATGKTNWYVSSIESILTNEKYKGDALLQKQYTVDFLTKARKTNEGEVQQYYVEGHHGAIIDPDTFDIVQQKWKEYREKQNRTHGSTIFNLKIKCGECGNYYIPKVWHSNDKYRRIIYQCGHKYKDGNICRTPHFCLEEIQKAFITAVNSLIAEKEETIENLRMLQKTACETENLKSERDALNGDVMALEVQLRQMIAENAHAVRNQDEYEAAYRKVYAEYEAKITRLDEVDEIIRESDVRRKVIDCFLERFNSIEGMLTVFDDDLWGGLVDCMTIYSKDNIVFTFNGGLEIKI